MPNKKVINATEVLYEGIKFRSKTEERFYKKLVKLGITPQYEPIKAILLDGFRPKAPFYIDGVPQINKNGDTSKIEAWSYTPDFVIKMGVHTFYIEAKGHPNDMWPYKRKMFLKWLEDKPNSFFFEAHTIRGLVDCVEIMKKISSENKGEIHN